MADSGPVILVDDDRDDEQLLKDALIALGVSNPLRYFEEPTAALRYLKATAEKPFIIISDINMPGQTGLEFKQNIDADPELRDKSIPFVFFSTCIDKKSVDAAYKHLTVQGFSKDSRFP